MNINTKTNQTIRTAFVTLIVVIGVVSVLSTGAAAYEPDEKDLSELDGSVAYEGQEVRANVSDLNLTGSETIYFTKINDDDSTNVVGTFTHGGNNLTNVSTDGRETGVKYGFSDTGTPSVSDVNGTFNLLSFDFSATWSELSVDDETGDAELEIDTNRRSGFPITINVNKVNDSSIEYEGLESLFSSATVTESREDIPFKELGYDPKKTSVQDVKDDGYITLVDWGSDNGNIKASFTNLESNEGLPTPDTYTFNLVVADTGDTSSADVEIGPAEESASIGKTLYESPAGDLFTFSVDMSETDETFVQIGGQNAGFADVLYIESTSSDPVSITVNTRLLGTNSSLTGDDVYDYENADTFVSAYHDSGTAPFDGNPTHNGVDVFIDGSPLSGGNALSYNEYASAAELTTSIERPLRQTQYSLDVAGTKNLDPAKQGVFKAENAKPTTILASGTLNLIEPEPKSVTVYKAPEAAADEKKSIESVLDEATQTTKMVENDLLVVEYTATGMFGGLIAGANGDRAARIDFDRNGQIDPSILHDYITSTDGLEMSIEGSSSTGNTKPPKVDLTAPTTNVNSFISPSDNQIVLVIDTSDSSSFKGTDPSGYSPFTAKLVYDGTGKEEKRYTFANEDANNGAFSQQYDGDSTHPYVSAGEKMEVKTEFDIVEPSISYEKKFPNGIRLQSTSSSTLTGETSFAPGSDVSIRLQAKNSDDYFEQKPSVTISSDGSFETTVDLSNREQGEEFSIEFLKNGRVIDESTGIITADLSEVETPERDENSTNSSDTTDSSSNTDDDSADVETSDDDQSSTNDQDGSTEEGLPGFGPIVAIVAIALSAIIARKK